MIGAKKTRSEQVGKAVLGCRRLRRGLARGFRIAELTRVSTLENSSEIGRGGLVRAVSGGELMNRHLRSTRRGRRWDRLGVMGLLVCTLGLGVSLPRDTSAQMLSVDETVALVRSVHFEGLPEEDAVRVGPDGAALLIEMLEDPLEAATHANILIVLGLCGQPGSLEAIAQWASIVREGEIDRDTFRAWQVLPYAVGYAARYDRRAIARLEANLEAEDPGWTYRHHRGARLVRQSRRATATALGMTGLPEAAAALDRAGRNATDAEFEQHLRGARAMHAQRAKKRRPE